MEKLAPYGYTRLEWTTTFEKSDNKNPNKLDLIVQDLIENRAPKYISVYMDYEKIFRLPDTVLIQNYLRTIRQATLVETKDSFYVAWSRN